MCNTTWTNTKEAVDKDFADKVMSQNDRKAALMSADGSLPIGPDTINKIKDSPRDKSTENVAKLLPKDNKKDDNQLQSKPIISFERKN